MNIQAHHDLTSIGHLAGQVQRSVRSIEHAADAIGIEPAVRINLVPHFDAEQVEKLVAYFREGATQ